MIQKLFSALALLSCVHATYAVPAEHEMNLSNPLVAQAFSGTTSADSMEQGDWAAEALRSVIQDSDLYKILLTLNITLPNMSRTAQYVMTLNEIHQVNQNLELILQELQKLNGR